MVPISTRVEQILPHPLVNANSPKCLTENYSRLPIPAQVFGARNVLDWDLYSNPLLVLISAVSRRTDQIAKQIWVNLSILKRMEGCEIDRNAYIRSLDELGRLSS